MKQDKGRLIVLDALHKKMLVLHTDGSKMTVLVDCGGTPDGISVDAANRHIYWTNMGEHWDQNDGYIERIDFDGRNRTVIVPKGATFTGKQMQLDLTNRFIYWCDREGMRVMRAAMDGTNITTLIVSGEGVTDRKDETKWPVGIALDVARGFMYWTQKGPSKGGKGRIFRAGLDLPLHQDSHNRSDIELLWGELPEPIDLELDQETGLLYWTDRGAPPDGNSLNRAGILGERQPQPQVLSRGLAEGIGLALDKDNDRIFFGDLGGTLYSSRLDGSERRVLHAGNHSFTGIAYIDNY